MRCPECNSRVRRGLLLCPECGTVIEETHPSRAQTPVRGIYVVDAASAERARERPRWQRASVILLWLAGFVVLVAASTGLAVYRGIRVGESDREETRVAAVEEHYQKGLARLESGEYELAIAEFEYVLELEPSHSFAPQGVSEAQSRLDQLRQIPTPTSVTYQRVTEDLFQQATGRFGDELWEDAVAVLTQLRVLDPEYNRTEVEDMLFASLYNAGLALLAEDRFEEGVFYLDQAVALRPLDENALTQRSLAVKYMTALGYWDVDWDSCIERFENLYAVAPSYKDVAWRLYRAHVTYADAWYDNGEMCPAETQYTLALQLFSDPEIDGKLVEARETCLIATPTPIAPLTGTLAITLTQPPPGFTVGRLAYPIYDTDTGTYDVNALYVDGRLVRVASGADQPSWLRGSGAIAYRDKVTPGISLIVPGEGSPRVVAAGAGLAWPSFSPDAGRLAYAARNAGGTWQVYIVLSDGSADPAVYADGEGPLWGPTGLLAWTGCDSTGACGIFVDNPDDDQPAVRLTASSNDIGLSWSPGGDALAYMSNVSGNWDIFLVNLSGGVIALTDDLESDGLPAWSPDGSRIAFVSNRDGGWGVYLLDPDARNQHKILSLGPNLPDWTGQRLSWAP